MRSNRWGVFVGSAALALALTGTSPASGQANSADSTAGRAPVKVGVILQTEGGVVTPEFGTAVTAMVAYFNAELGGVGGRRLVAEVCNTDDTPASATACGTRFANAPDVHLVIESTTNPGAIADALAPSGKALLAGGVDFGNMLRPGVFVMEPGGAGIANSLFSYAATDVGITHFTVFHADDPAVEGLKPVIDLIAANAGLVIDAYVPLGFTGDLTAPIAAGINPASDGLAFIVAPPQCAPVGQALQTLGNELPVVVAELCLMGDVIDSGLAEGWYAGTQSLGPVANGGREALKIRRILTRYGDGEAGGFAGLGVGYAWMARDVLARAGAGSATDGSVMRVLRSYSTPDVLGFDQITCPGPAPFISACNAETLMVQVTDRQLYDVGGWHHTDFTMFEPLLGP